MGKYGETSIIATKLMLDGIANSPIQAWEQAVLQVFPHSKPSREKGCPKNTYLGLCEEGLVSGVEPGNFTRSKKNKEYGLQAIYILTENPSLAEDEKALWDRILGGKNKTPNHQMEVVCSLWNNGLIQLKS